MYECIYIIFVLYICCTVVYVLATFVLHLWLLPTVCCLLHLGQQPIAVFVFALTLDEGLWLSQPVAVMKQKPDKAVHLLIEIRYLVHCALSNCNPIAIQ